MKISTIFLVGLALTLSFSPVHAKEVTEQKVDNNQSYLTANVQNQKNPEKQKIGNHFSFFTINIQVVRQVPALDSTVR